MLEDIDRIHCDDQIGYCLALEIGEDLLLESESFASDFCMSLKI